MMMIERKIEARKAEGLPFALGNPRQIKPRESVHLRWPKNSAVADEYVTAWREIAEAELGRLSLSRDTVRAIASHVSRRTGEARITDAMLSTRARRSLGSVKRDIRRAKDLGLILVTYEAGTGGRERVRVIRLSVPVELQVVVSTCPPQDERVVVSTWGVHVETPDYGGTHADV